MGQRSRRRASGEGAPPPGGADRPAGARPSRTAQKDAEARARLEPLAPGERPTAVTVAAVIAAALAVGNVVAYAAGARVEGQEGSAVGVVGFAGLMLVAAGGMWQGRYWAVLGFQALLAVTILIAALSLAVASNVTAVVLCLAIVLPAGYLFTKLVRALARLQMPERRRSR